MNKQLIKEVKTYLQETLGVADDISVVEKKWADAKQLPFYLQDTYTFIQTTVLNKPCLFMLSRSEIGETPAVVKKHWQLINERYSGDVIYLVETITSFNRKRLIEQKVPFVVPGKQLYLPMLGIDLREQFKSITQNKKKNLSAAAQVLVLRELLGSDDKIMSAKELAALLGYSAMTLTRAINELLEKELAIAETVGREKQLKFVLHNKALWEATKPYMKNPRKKYAWIDAEMYSQLSQNVELKVAGESALANNSMVMEPGNEVVAIQASEWPEFKTLMGIEERHEHDFDCIKIELWRYSPGLLSIGESVDPFSLWLSLQGERDERIDMALDELLEKAWSTYAN